MAGDEQAIRATARGKVQGVGYRWAVVERALALGVLGWVRNQDDGSVLVHAEGPQDAVVALATFLHDGSPGAAVEAVDVAGAKVEGHEQFAIRGVPAGRFIVEELGGDDAATYVLHLERTDRTGYHSWRLTKPPSMTPADKRFATATDGDPIAGAAAGSATVGAAPAGGTSEAPTAWDSGTYEQGGRVAWPEAVDRGHAVFVLHGERLQGGFALQRTRGSGPGAGWLLIKRRDEFAAA